MPSVVIREPVRSVEDLRGFLHACNRVFDSPAPDGDPVDILAHSLQCAFVLRAVAEHDPDLQVAGLVHDLGHVVAAGTSDDHGAMGADFVRPLLGERVARLTALHVPAKRYLVATDPRYASVLSGGSTHSLARQGGAMTPSEVVAFESDPWARDAATLRRADEAAKVVGRVVPGVDEWLPVLEAVALKR